MHFQYQDFTQGSIEAQSAYFQFCEKLLRSKFFSYQGPTNPYWGYGFSPYWGRNGAPDYNSYSQLNQLIQELYDEGKDIYLVLICSFSEFKAALYTGNHLYGQSRYYGRPAAKKSSYRRQTHHCKKVISQKEQAKIDWREKKGFAKDHARRSNGFYGNSKKVCKKLSNHYHRQWERQCLHYEKYDELSDFKNKTIFDPWMYD